MCGKATLTMVVSNTCITVAAITAKVIKIRRDPSSCVIRISGSC